MPEPIRPASAKLFGRKNYLFIPTIASATLAPTVAEATAASALDISRILFAGGEPTPGATVNRTRMGRRAGDTEDFESIGTTSWEGNEMICALNPQAAAASDGKKAWEKFVHGTTGFLAKREAIARDTNIIAGQFLTWVVPVEYSQPIPMEQGEGEAAESAFRSPFAITGAPKFVVAVLT